MTSHSRKRDLDEGMITPPSTPKRTRRKTRQNADLSPSNQPTNDTLTKSRELLDCFITSISHRECCPDDGNFTWHKGIDPGYPKGHYCCQNVCMSSDQELSVKYIAPYFVVYGSHGPLGCLTAEESDAMRKRIGELGGDCAVEIVVSGFSCFKDEITLKRVSGSFPIKYAPCSAVWRITISFYSPLFSPLSPRLLTWGEESSDWNLIQHSPSEMDGRITPPSRSLLVELPSPFSRPLTPTPSLSERDLPSFCLCTSPHRYLSHSKRHSLSTR